MKGIGYGGEVMLGYVIYLVTLSLQASAAALLVGNVNTKMKYVAVDAYINSIIPQVENGIIQNYEPVRRAMKIAMVNKVALCFLLLGYLFSTLGMPLYEYRWISLVIVVLLVCLEYLGTHKIVDCCIRKMKFHNILVDDVAFPKGTIIMDSSSRDA